MDTQENIKTFWYTKFVSLTLGEYNNVRLRIIYHNKKLYDILLKWVDFSNFPTEKIIMLELKLRMRDEV